MIWIDIKNVLLLNIWKFGHMDVFQYFWVNTLAEPALTLPEVLICPCPEQSRKESGSQRKVSSDPQWTSTPFHDQHTGDEDTASSMETAPSQLKVGEAWTWGLHRYTPSCCSIRLSLLWWMLKCFQWIIIVFCPQPIFFRLKMILKMMLVESLCKSDTVM